jgi:hypothetical protein
MLRSLAILVVILTPTQTPVDTPRQRGSQQDHASHDAAKGNDVSPSATQPPTEFRPVFQAPKWEPKSDPTQQKPGYWKEAFGPAYLSNWALVLVGGVAGFLAWRTLNSIEIQSEAAAKSTAAYINKERSRLFIRKHISSDFEATFRAANWGFSPARITYGFVGCEIFSPTEKFREIPEYDNGEDSSVYAQDEWIPANKIRRIGSYDASYVSTIDTPHLYDSVMSGELILWFYGVVRYRDSVSEDEHEVRFCYRCYPAKNGRHSLFSAGPEAYRLET